MTIHDGRDKYGRYYEEFEVGDVYKHWPSKTITEAQDQLFCDITMNHHPLHSDRWYAEEETQFKQNVVVGNFVYSLVLGMSVADVSGKAIANLEIESLKHSKPTFHGDTIRAETTVLDKVETSDGKRGIVTVETRGVNQRGEEVCYFRRKVMVPRRPGQEQS
jgi:acyl dehydratase